jgi:hypothetical protein
MASAGVPVPRGKTNVVLVDANGGAFTEARVVLEAGAPRRKVLASLKKCARAALPRDGRQGQYRHFRLMGAFPEDGGRAISLYAFHTGPGRPNRHEPPPGLTEEPLVYGPIVVVRQHGSAPRDVSAAEYQAFLHGAVASVSLGESDSERSTDGSDDGADLEGFIVGDDVED